MDEVDIPGHRKRIGILTSGGDCPGLNAVIRGAVIKGVQVHDVELVGIRNGWRGLLDEQIVPLSRNIVRGLGTKGGTILGTSRTNPVDIDRGATGALEAMDHLRLDGLIAIGGEGTLSAARRLSACGVRLIGVPKTIDNDLSATDYSFGFDTAVQIATEAMDRLRTTGESHNRCMIAEVMGRHAGWIALHSGIAASAHAILIPERPVDLAQICTWVRSCFDSGRVPLVVVAEGFRLVGMDDIHAERGIEKDGRPRLGGIGEYLAPLIEATTGIETRATTLGHIQRGGTPTAFDRVLSTRLGMAAIDSAIARRWGTMVALRGTEIVNAELEAASAQLSTVPDHRYEEAAVLFG